ncbi:hypothetical protein, partial [Streptomyces zhihengii]|uniref:hypothetical protein n=1 Tax=Streptomyces zhihengii TaxID=1818004 RepID=UPI0033B95332
MRDAFVEAVDRLFGSGRGREVVDSLVRSADDVARMAREFAYVLAKTTASLIGHAVAFAAELAVTVALSAWNPFAWLRLALLRLIYGARMMAVIARHMAWLALQASLFVALQAALNVLIELFAQSSARAKGYFSELDAQSLADSGAGGALGGLLAFLAIPLAGAGASALMRMLRGSGKNFGLDIDQALARELLTDAPVPPPARTSTDTPVPPPAGGARGAAASAVPPGRELERLLGTMANRIDKGNAARFHTAFTDDAASWFSRNFAQVLGDKGAQDAGRAWATTLLSRYGHRDLGTRLGAVLDDTAGTLPPTLRTLLSTGTTRFLDYGWIAKTAGLTVSITAGAAAGVLGEGGGNLAVNGTFTVTGLAAISGAVTGGIETAVEITAHPYATQLAQKYDLFNQWKESASLPSRMEQWNRFQEQRDEEFARLAAVREHTGQAGVREQTTTTLLEWHDKGWLPGTLPDLTAVLTDSPGAAPSRFDLPRPEAIRAESPGVDPSPQAGGGPRNPTGGELSGEFVRHALEQEHVRILSAGAAEGAAASGGPIAESGRQALEDQRNTALTRALEWSARREEVHTAFEGDFQDALWQTGLTGDVHLPEHHPAARPEQDEPGGGPDESALLRARPVTADALSAPSALPVMDLAGLRNQLHTAYLHALDQHYAPASSGPGQDGGQAPGRTAPAARTGGGDDGATGTAPVVLDGEQLAVREDGVGEALRALEREAVDWQRHTGRELEGSSWLRLREDLAVELRQSFGDLVTGPGDERSGTPAPPPEQRWRSHLEEQTDPRALTERLERAHSEQQAFRDRLDQSLGELRADTGRRIEELAERTRAVGHALETADSRLQAVERDLVDGTDLPAEAMARVRLELERDLHAAHHALYTPSPPSAAEGRPVTAGTG